MNYKSTLFFNVKFLIAYTIFIFFTTVTGFTQKNNEQNRIQPYSENPFYWQYKGKPVLLLGGTDQDNLFNHPKALEPDGLESHLDLLVSVGGNYVRNTMSHRDAPPGSEFLNTGAPNEFAYKRKTAGLFDLTKWNNEYWKRFDNFLKLTEARDIIVQIEVWETWDHYADHEPQGGWSRNPFNPVNNINYNVVESKLLTEINYNPTSKPTTHNFFHTVPELENNVIVLDYQKAFINKILSYSFKYDHVLYCMNNETGEPTEWGEYWVDFIGTRAKEMGKTIEITDMRRSEELSSSDHRVIQNKPEIYSFIEVSQNNGHSRRGQNHWDPLMEVRKYIAKSPRPVNNVKIYGGEAGGWSGIDQGIQKFWRNIFAGCASARFHRRFPASGIGLNNLAQNNIRSARMLTDSMNVFTAIPGNDLLSEREDNEAYLLAEQGKQYALYFPNSGEVSIDLSGEKGQWRLKWLNISGGIWLNQKEVIRGGDKIQIKTPGIGHWAALILPVE